jgi:histidinol-phosphate aminotransferase
MNNVVARLISARVPPAVASLSAYVPDRAIVGDARLDANEAPAWLPTLTVEERALWNDALTSIEPARYPDVRADALREATSRALGVAPNQLVFGCGSDELIAMIVAAFGAPIDGRPARVLVPSPSFVMYGVSARVHGVEPVSVPLDEDCDLDVAAMTTAMHRERPAVVFLATPNNPTAGAYSLARVRALIRVAATIDPPTLVVVDEAYLAFRLGDGDPWNGVTGVDLLTDHDHVIVLRTLSKIGLAALRVGFAIAAPIVAEQLDKVRLPYDLPAPSQVGATLAMTSLAPAIERHVSSIRDERGRLLEALAALGVDAGRSDANFFWLDVGDGAAVQAALRDRRVMVRAFAHSPKRVRVSVGSRADNDRFVAALAESRHIQR